MYDKNASTKLYNTLMGNPSANNAIGRTAGSIVASAPSNDNFFVKRGKSIENAIGTSLATAVGGINELAANENRNSMVKDQKTRMNDIAKKYGYNTWADWQDGYQAAQEAGDTAKVSAMQEQLKEFQNQANANANEMNKYAANYKDYVKNDYIGQKTNQDAGKFAGSAINTVSTMADVLLPGAGVAFNSVQGGLEGVADELEQNGLENFDWGRAGQNALIGATTGGVVGAFNKGLSNSLAKNGGNLFKGGNAITRGLNDLGSKTALGRVGSTIATGAGRGALSGAVGGATSAGLSAAMNNQDVLGSAIQGAVQGAKGGAVTGGIMAGANMALNKTPLMQKINQANEDWKNSGENFKERWQNTREQDTWGNRLIDNTKARLQNGALSIKDVGAEMNNANPMDYMSNDTNAAVQKFLDTLTPEGQIPTEGYAYGKNASARREAIASLRNEFTDGELATLMDNETDPKLKALYADAGGQNPSSELADWGQVIKEEKPVAEPVEQTPQTEDEEFAAYGESDLATGKTKKQNILSKAGRRMMAAQSNATRKETRDIGIEDAGDLINKVRKRSGISDLEKQSAFAKELTGGENSLLDAVQRNAIAATEDGSLRTVNLDAVQSNVNKLIDELPNTMVSPTQKETIREAVLADLTNGSIDTITKANNFKAAAAQQFLINERTPNESAKALGVFYTKVGDLVDDASYAEIPKTQIEAMFETAASEARTRANTAAKNGKTDIETAYTKLADELDSSPKTMRAYRSLKKDYVDVNKLNKKTQQGATAWNNSPLVMGTALTTAMATGNPLVAVPTAWAAKTFAPAVGQAAIDASASIGGKLADWGDALAAKNTGVKAPTPTTPTTTAAEVYNPSTQVYNAIGRTEGLTNGEQARTANYLVDAVQNTSSTPNASATTLEGLITPTTSSATSVYNLANSTPTTTQTASNQVSYFQPTGDYWTDILARAMTSAINADDVEAFASLYGMYQDALSNLQKSDTSSSEVKLSDKQRQANAAARALDDFEASEHNFAYDISDIPVIGNIANLGGNSYTSKAEALALQVGYMLSGATVNREEAKNIGMAYVPQPRDNEAVRRSKLEQLRGIISDYQKTYAD